MQMKKIMNEWKKFTEVRIYKRIVLNELVEVTQEELKNFPLSQEELEILRRWGGLEGEPRFLGSGTMGSAYQFNDKVLKITSDSAEANAAGLIKGLSHPNVYKIQEVGLRPPQFKEEPHRRLAIVYDLVTPAAEGEELPSKMAQEVIKSIHNTSEKVKYNHPQNFMELISKFIETTKEHPEVFETEDPDNSKKIQKIMQLAGFDYQQKEAVLLSIRLIIGIYGKCYTSVESLVSCLTDRKEFDYYNQICSGLTFLAKHSIFFGDLKTTNVMKVGEDQLVIIDVGKSMVRNYFEIPQIK